MRLFTFDVVGHTARRPVLGAELQGGLVDLAAAYAAYVERHAGLVASEGSGAGLPLRGLPMLLSAGESGRAVADVALRFAAEMQGAVAGHLRYEFADIRLRPPLLRPGKIICAGVNYHGHLLENPAAIRPDEPFFFAKMSSGVIGPGDAIVKPALTEQLDYEVELAIIIGRKMRSATPESAMEYVAGYSIMNDVSARDIQFRNNQITLGKNFDTFAPLGPCVVTAEELGDVSGLRLRTWVNDELRQDATTADMIFSVPELLSRLSAVMTLEPGDIVSTGTPAGVGVFRQPPAFLAVGDTIRMEIDGVGELVNHVVAPLP